MALKVPAKTFNHMAPFAIELFNQLHPLFEGHFFFRIFFPIVLGNFYAIKTFEQNQQGFNFLIVEMEIWHFIEDALGPLGVGIF